MEPDVPDAPDAPDAHDAHDAPDAAPDAPGAPVPDPDLIDQGNVDTLLKDVESRNQEIMDLRALLETERLDKIAKLGAYHDLTACSIERSYMDAHVDQLQKQLAEATTLNNTYFIQNDQLHHQVTKLKERNDEYENIKFGHMRELSDRNNQISNLKAQVEGIEKELETSNTDKATLGTDNTKLKNELKSSNTDKATLEKDNAKLKNELKSSKTRMIMLGLAAIFLIGAMAWYQGPLSSQSDITPIVGATVNQTCDCPLPIACPSDVGATTATTDDSVGVGVGGPDEAGGASEDTDVSTLAKEMEESVFDKMEQLKLTWFKDFETQMKEHKLCGNCNNGNGNNGNGNGNNGNGNGNNGNGNGNGNRNGNGNNGNGNGHHHWKNRQTASSDLDRDNTNLRASFGASLNRLFIDVIHVVFKGKRNKPSNRRSTGV
ncbi:hypothetical protein SAMD00019534_019360 [Acytostelium subglobosum LB1]|uniref:hypothetical protein n=1 Tax=Acytostelium subglobosum LB1 TaxID=1410327 RepID=UPI00064512E3|nr:hypothetical protein SAMD00019534_019360 [Acytostelium subglobosum LB1]GAM18761.1 hypothetical protein SAMD00019534_019360 [Acytostelium subglobosum LB1]|eukprot:XP_012757981.1 hypothetical protein SAMD00019534_019360 [Acytostelium subglobosum LB1]